MECLGLQCCKVYAAATVIRIAVYSAELRKGQRYIFLGDGGNLLTVGCSLVNILILSLKTGGRKVLAGQPVVAASRELFSPHHQVGGYCGPAL